MASVSTGEIKDVIGYRRQLPWMLIFGALTAATGLTLYALAGLLTFTLHPLPAGGNGRLMPLVQQPLPSEQLLAQPADPLLPPVVEINRIALPAALASTRSEADAVEAGESVPNFADAVDETAVFPASAAAPSTAQLIIPSLGIDHTIQSVPIINGSWDISQLSAGVGHLTSTGAAPQHELAPALVAHVTTENGDPGPFYRLTELTPNQDLIYRYDGVDYVYKVQTFDYVSPDQVDALYWSDENGLLLATCTGWSYVNHAYDQRLIVRAVLVDAVPTPIQ